MAEQPIRRDDRADSDGGPFKVCDLCGALNHSAQAECFVCGWHGHFTTDPETVYEATVLGRAGSEKAATAPSPAAPPALTAVAPPLTEPITARAGFFARLGLFFRRLLHRP